MKKILPLLLFLFAFTSQAQTKSGINWDKYYITGSLMIGQGVKDIWANDALWLQVGKDNDTKGFKMPWVIDTSDVVFPRPFGTEVGQLKDSSKYVWVGNRWKGSASGSSGSTTDTLSLSNRINQRMKYTDTPAMLLPYALKAKLKSDSTVLSNETSTRLKITDTSNMLLPYARKSVLIDTANALQGRMNTKLGIADTAFMLLNYAKQKGLNDTAIVLRGLVSSSIVDTNSLSNRINQRVKYTDTAGMLANYAKQKALGDTASAIRATVPVLDTGRTNGQIATSYAQNKIEDSLGTLIVLKQNQLSGTGFVKASGTTISYDNTSYLTTETDPVVKAINGLIKSNGTVISAAVAGTDYLTPTGSAAGLTSFPTFNQNTTGSAATWTTGRTIAITGDLSYTSPSLNGSSNVTAAGTLATVNSNVGSFGSASAVATFTTNAKGLTTAAGSTAIQIPESQVTNLVSDLGLKAPLASPSLTGTPTAPTAAAGTNTTQLATTAFTTVAVSLKIDSMRRQPGTQQVQMKINGTWVNAYTDSVGSGGGGGWGLLGTSGTNPTTNFCGTYDNVDFILAANSQKLVRLYANGSQAYGLGATATGYLSTAIGVNSKAGGSEATSYGRNADATGDASLALGYGPTAIGIRSVAINNGAYTTHAGSMVTTDGVSSYDPSSAISRWTDTHAGGIELKASTSATPTTTIGLSSGISIDLPEATRAMKPNRGTTSQRLALTATESQLYYDMTLHKLYVYDGTTWQACW